MRRFLSILIEQQIFHAFQYNRASCFKDFFQNLFNAAMETLVQALQMEPLGLLNRWKMLRGL